jgi:hypothetical protein
MIADSAEAQRGKGGAAMDPNPHRQTPHLIRRTDHAEGRSAKGGRAPPTVFRNDEAGKISTSHSPQKDMTLQKPCAPCNPDQIVKNGPDIVADFILFRMIYIAPSGLPLPTSDRHKPPQASYPGIDT